MATAPRKGFNRSRNQGSGASTQGLSEYTIASGYATALGTGDPVKLTTDGSIIQATNSASTLGVFQGCRYIDSSGRIQIQKYWPASQTSTETVTALVADEALATWRVKTAGTISTSVTIPGALYPMVLTAPDATTGRSQMTVNNIATVTGSLAVTGTNNAGLTGLANSDAFQIKSSVANTNTTITIVTNQTPAQLLALLNAVPGISASLNASNYLVVVATDGGNIVLTDGSGTPLADSSLLAAAGTTTATVAQSAAMVEVVRMPSLQDITDGVLEVMLVNNKYITALKP